MNKKIFGLIIGILLIGTLLYVSANVSFGEKTSSGLVGHWTLDEKDYDSSTGRITDITPYGHHGTDADATFTTDRMGIAGGAMSFDGSDSFTTDQIFTDDVNQEWTVAGWVYLDRNNVNQYFNNFNSGNRITYSSSTKALLYGNSGENDHYTYSSGTIPTGQWIYFTYVYRTSDQTCKIYLDGELDKSSTNYGVGDVPSGFSSSTVFGSGFDGKMDDIRVYNRVLSDDEIKSLYDSYQPKASAGSLQKGLVGYWTLDEVDYNSDTNRVTDKSAYENHGTNNGANLTTDRFGKENGAMSFDGSSNYISGLDSNNPSILEPSSITISSWINMDQDASTDRHIWFTKWYGYSNEIEANTRLPYLRLRGPGDIKSNTSITLGNWHHFVGTYDPSVGGEVYLDGILVGTKGPSGEITHSRNYPLNLGRYSGGVYFNGSIDEARIYNRALSEEEIKLLYDSYQPKASASSLQKGLILDMPLTLGYTKDETAGSEIMTDRTPYSNDGQNYGATLGSDGASFDDSNNDMISISNINFEDNESWTFSNWVNWTGQTDSYVFYAGSGEGTKNFLLRYSNNNRFAFRSGTTGYASFEAGSSNEIIGNWCHLAWVADGSGNLSLYLNGILLDTLTDVGTNIYFNYLGKGYSSRDYATYPDNTYYLRGLMSNVRIYNRALSEDEIKSLYGKGRY